MTNLEGQFIQKKKKIPCQGLQPSMEKTMLIREIGRRSTLNPRNTMSRQSR